MSAPAPRPRLFARPAPYAAWFALSAIALEAGRRLDPYLLGATAFVAAALSAVLAVVALYHGPRAFAFAVLAALPTGIAFWLLSTYSWA